MDFIILAGFTIKTGIWMIRTTYRYLIYPILFRSVKNVNLIEPAMLIEIKSLREKQKELEEKNKKLEEQIERIGEVIVID
ncbi:Uncharacterised protein [uncultured archaeon]|nr:Uncharacterised protein [uncultured archaeon]